MSMDKGLELKESSYRGPDLKLFVRDVRDLQGRKRPITVRSWSCIKDVKDIIQQMLHVPPSSQRLYFGPLLTSGGELPNHRTLHDAGIYRSGETLLLDIKGGSLGDKLSLSSLYSQADTSSDVSISSSVIDSTPRLLRQLVQQARRGLALGLKPEFVLDGSGGTYFLHDARKVKIAVFKPADEEPYAQNNPRGYLAQPGQAMYLREGVVPGQACIREVAAFMLDHGGFSGVPMTTLAEARHPSFNNNGSRLKVIEGGASIGAHSIVRNSVSVSPSEKKPGSFQEFVRTECSMDDLSPSKISADEVHKIAILDIRLMNADRNAANLLCRRKRDNSIELVPIDHGFCLRSVGDVSWMDWCWLDWPQLKEVSVLDVCRRGDYPRANHAILTDLTHDVFVYMQPLSEKTKNYVLALDIEADARMLRDRLNICKEALEYFRASSSILKEGIRAGLSLYEIAVMCCRNDNLGEVPSKLEVLFSMASELAHSAVQNGRWHHVAASRALADQLSPKGGSLLSINAAGGLHKSMSALHFPQMLEGKVVEFQDTAKRELPGMIQSSASDSSSDTDCEEWAANLIADVSLDKSISMMNTKARSPSIESDSSSDSGSSGSPRGFWHVAPGKFSDTFEEEDDSVTWNATADHEELNDETASAGEDDMGVENWNPTAAGRRNSSCGLSNLQHSLAATLPINSAATSVRFSETCEFVPPPSPKMASWDDSDFFPPSSPKKQEGGRIPRSQSYSALSAVTEEKKVSAETKSLFREEPEEYRKYFFKFVDLVIVREITAASRLTGVAS